MYEGLFELGDDERVPVEPQDPTSDSGEPSDTEEPAEDDLLREEGGTFGGGGDAPGPSTTSRGGTFGGGGDG